MLLKTVQESATKLSEVTAFIWKGLALGCPLSGVAVLRIRLWCSWLVNGRENVFLLNMRGVRICYWKTPVSWGYLQLGRSKMGWWGWGLKLLAAERALAGAPDSRSFQTALWVAQYPVTPRKPLKGFFFKFRSWCSLIISELRFSYFA